MPHYCRDCARVFAEPVCPICYREAGTVPAKPSPGRVVGSRIMPLIFDGKPLPPGTKSVVGYVKPPAATKAKEVLRVKRPYRQRSGIAHEVRVCANSNCKGEFHPKKADQIFCSFPCWTANRNAGLERVVCTCANPNCGKTFTLTPGQIRQGMGKYCSTECKNAARVKSCTCQNAACRKAFTVPLNKFNAGRGRFCSRACVDAAQRGQPKGKTAPVSA